MSTQQIEPPASHNLSTGPVRNGLFARIKRAVMHFFSRLFTTSQPASLEGHVKSQIPDPHATQETRSVASHMGIEPHAHPQESVDLAATLTSIHSICVGLEQRCKKKEMGLDVDQRERLSLVDMRKEAEAQLARILPIPEESSIGGSGSQRRSAKQIKERLERVLKRIQKLIEIQGLLAGDSENWEEELRAQQEAHLDDALIKLVVSVYERKTIEREGLLLKTALDAAAAPRSFQALLHPARREEDATELLARLEKEATAAEDVERAATFTVIQNQRLLHETDLEIDRWQKRQEEAIINLKHHKAVRCPSDIVCDEKRGACAGLWDALKSRTDLSQADEEQIVGYSVQLADVPALRV